MNSAVKYDEHPAKASGSKSNGRLALIISFTALFFTGLNFWWNNLREVNHLEARVLGATHYAHGEAHTRDTLSVGVVYYNTGNRQVLIGNPDFVIANDNEVYTRSSLVRDSRFPFVMGPSEVRLVKLKIPMGEFLRMLPGSSQVLLNQDGQEVYSCVRYCAIDFTAIDSKGRVHCDHVSPYYTSIDITIPLHGESSISGLFDTLPFTGPLYPVERDVTIETVTHTGGGIPMVIVDNSVYE